MNDDKPVSRKPNFWRTHRNYRKPVVNDPARTFEPTNNVTAQKYRNRITLAPVSITKKEASHD